MEERSSEGAEAQSSQSVARRRRRAPRIQNTLAIFVQSLQGSTIAVELKNDIEITGVLEESDVSMKSVRCTAWPVVVILVVDAHQCCSPLTTGACVFPVLPSSMTMRSVQQTFPSVRRTCCFASG
jgi:hypothetical protein